VNSLTQWARVGTIITECLPRRSVRALLRIRLMESIRTRPYWMQTREASPSVTSKTEAARMLERRIRAVSLGAGLAKCRKDPLRLFVQCFSEQFEELDRSKTPGLVHELSSLGSCGSTSGPWKSGNRAVPSPTPKQLPLFYWSATIRTRSTDWASPFISERALRCQRDKANPSSRQFSP
jgi:hypothetical protein